MCSCVSPHAVKRAEGDKRLPSQRYDECVCVCVGR